MHIFFIGDMPISDKIMYIYGMYEKKHMVQYISEKMHMLCISKNSNFCKYCTTHTVKANLPIHLRLPHLYCTKIESVCRWVCGCVSRIHNNLIGLILPKFCMSSSLSKGAAVKNFIRGAWFYAQNRKIAILGRRKSQTKLFHKIKVA